MICIQVLCPQGCRDDIFPEDEMTKYADIFYNLHEKLYDIKITDKRERGMGKILNILWCSDDFVIRGKLL